MVKERMDSHSRYPEIIVLCVMKCCDRSKNARNYTLVLRNSYLYMLWSAANLPKSALTRNNCICDGAL